MYDLEQMYQTRKLLERLHRYLAGSLPTHLARGGEVDRQQLLVDTDRRIFDLTIDQ